MDLVIDEGAYENTVTSGFTSQIKMRYPFNNEATLMDQQEEPRYSLDYNMPKVRAMEEKNMYQNISDSSRTFYENMDVCRKDEGQTEKSTTHVPNMTMSSLQKVMANSTSANLEPSALKNKVNLNRLAPAKAFSSLSSSTHAPQSMLQSQQSILQLNAANQKQMRQELAHQTHIKQEDISLQDQLISQGQTTINYTGFRTSPQDVKIKTEQMDSSEFGSKNPTCQQKNFPYSNLKQQQPNGKVANISKSEEERRIKIERHCLHLEHASYCQENVCVIPLCKKMKKVIHHSLVCRKPNKQTSCVICKQYTLLCCLHARRCIKDVCKVSFCQKFREQKRRQLMKANKGSSVLRRTLSQD